ncbi:hypothetical protein [Tropicimonas sp.]
MQRVYTRFHIVLIASMLLMAIVVEALAAPAASEAANPGIVQVAELP